MRFFSGDIEMITYDVISGESAVPKQRRRVILRIAEVLSLSWIWSKQLPFENAPPPPPFFLSPFFLFSSPFPLLLFCCFVLFCFLFLSFCFYFCFLFVVKVIYIYNR